MFAFGENSRAQLGVGIEDYLRTGNITTIALNEPAYNIKSKQSSVIFSSQSGLMGFGFGVFGTLGSQQDVFRYATHPLLKFNSPTLIMSTRGDARTNREASVNDFAVSVHTIVSISIGNENHVKASGINSNKQAVPYMSSPVLTEISLLDFLDEEASFFPKKVDVGDEHTIALSNNSVIYVWV